MLSVHTRSLGPRKDSRVYLTTICSFDCTAIQILSLVENMVVFIHLNRANTAHIYVEIEKEIDMNNAFSLSI